MSVWYRRPSRRRVLYNPIKEQLFEGIVGQGATLNGEPIHVTDHGDLQGSKVVCSRTEMKKGWFDDFEDVLTPVPVGSVAYKFGLVAAGMAESTFTPRPRSEWDICGGVAIVEAAGGRCSDRTGAPYVFNRPKPLVDGVAASNGHIHQAILSHGPMIDLSDAQHAAPGLCTFAMGIQMLPQPFEPWVTVGYLLCRVVDTVEDTESIEGIPGAGSSIAFEKALTTGDCTDFEATLVPSRTTRTANSAETSAASSTPC